MKSRSMNEFKKMLTSMTEAIDTENEIERSLTFAMTGLKSLKQADDLYKNK